MQPDSIPENEEPAQQQDDSGLDESEMPADSSSFSEQFEEPAEQAEEPKLLETEPQQVSQVDFVDSETVQTQEQNKAEEQNIQAGAQQFSEDKVALDESNFPDAGFREYLAQFDVDSDGMFSQQELLAVTAISLRAKQISNLKGIEHFTALTYLNVEMNQLTSLDLSLNTQLEVLIAANNLLSQVVLPQAGSNSILRKVDRIGNQLTELNPDGMSGLRMLAVDDNKLTTLDLRDWPLDEGYGFSANDNYITSVTLPGGDLAYEFTTNLAEQRLPQDKTIGYQVVWYTDPDHSSPLETSAGGIICQGQTLYAAVEPVQYTLEFLPGNQNVTGQTDSMDMVYDKAFNLPACGFIPTDDEWEFAGWNISGKLYQQAESVKNLTSQHGARLTAVAQWKANDFFGQEYTVWLKNGQQDTQQLTGTYGEALVLNASFNREHYHLAGWSLTPDDTVWRKAGVAVARSYRDYTVTVDESLPDGVTCERMG